MKTQVIKNPPEEARQLLHHTLRRLRRVKVAKRLYADHPNLEVLSQRLVWHITPTLVYPFGKDWRTISECCLEEAISRALGAADTAPKTYIQGMRVWLSMLLELTVMSGAMQWNPVLDDPLMAWLQEHPDAKVEALVGKANHLPAPAQFTHELMLRLVEPQDAHWVEEQEGVAA